MRKLLFPFLFLSPFVLSAQVKIGHNASKLSTSPGAVLLQLSSDTTMPTKPAKALVLPGVKGTQRMKMESPDIGLLLYNVDSSFLEYTHRKGGSVTWQALRFGNANAGKGRFIKIEAKDTVGGNFPKIDGSVTEVTINKNKNAGKLQYLPYTNGARATMATTSTTATMPRTKISYNGLVLTPTEDYTVELVEGSSSTGTTTTKNVKITFKTLIPEKWDEFDEFFIEYEVI